MRPQPRVSRGSALLTSILVGLGITACAGPAGPGHASPTDTLLAGIVVRDAARISVRSPEP